jgi:hypothetical protein
MSAATGSRSAFPTFFTRRSWAAESSLAPNPYRVELRGRTGAVVWPPYCPACGASARRKLRVQKVFVRRRRRGTDPTVITALNIPYCDACIAEHERIRPRQSPIRHALTYVASPMLLPIFGFGWMTSVWLKDGDSMPRALAGLTGAITSGAILRDGVQALGPALPLLFPALVVACVIAMIYQTRYFRVQKQSEVTRACDFSDNIGDVIAGSRRVYTIRNEGFAQAFTEANRKRLWTGADEKRASYRYGAFLIVVLAAGAVAWWLGYLR